MTDKRKIQLEAGLGTEGVRKGAAEVKQVVHDMAVGVQQDANTAAKSVDGIGTAGTSAAKQLDAAGGGITGSLKRAAEEAQRSGRTIGDTLTREGERGRKGLSAAGDGGTDAARKVELATRNIAAQMQRVMAVSEAGERGTAKYFEALAKQRGANLADLRPLIDQMKALEAAQAKASSGLGSMEMSAKATAAALRGVPAQFTDIFVGLASGQQPMMVLLQQGGQLKDMFGGVGVAAKALGGYVLGLINPVSMAAAALGTLGIAFYRGAAEAAALERSIVLSGRSAILSGFASTWPMSRLIQAAGGGVQQQPH